MKHAPNNVSQRTFDPLPIFAYAKTVIASNAAELWRYVAKTSTTAWEVYRI